MPFCLRVLLDFEDQPLSILLEVLAFEHLCAGWTVGLGFRDRV